MKKSILKILSMAFTVAAFSSSSEASDTIGRSFLFPTKINNQPNDRTSLESSPIIIAAKNDAAEVASKIGGDFSNDQLEQESDVVSEEIVEDGNVEDNTGNEEEGVDCTKTPEHTDCQNDDGDEGKGSCSVDDKICDTNYENDPETFCSKFPSDNRCAKDDGQSCSSDQRICDSSYDSDPETFCSKFPSDNRCIKK